MKLQFLKHHKDKINKTNNTKDKRKSIKVEVDLQWVSLDLSIAVKIRFSSDGHVDWLHRWFAIKWDSNGAIEPKMVLISQLKMASFGSLSYLIGAFYFFGLLVNHDNYFLNTSMVFESNQINWLG